MACLGGGLAKQYLEAHEQVSVQLVQCRVRDAKERGGFLMLLLLLLFLLLSMWLALSRSSIIISHIVTVTIGVTMTVVINIAFSIGV